MTVEYILDGDTERHGWLVEGRVLLGYVLGRPPSLGLLRRYARALPKVRPGEFPLAFPKLLRWYPFLLRFVEPTPMWKGPRGRVFQSRLHLAVILTETSQEGACPFSDPCGASIGRVVTKMIGLVTVEVLVFPVRMLITVFLR